MPTLKTGRARRPIPSEHAEQAALFDWWNLQHKKSAMRELLFAIPNGGARSAITGAMLKAEGVRKGIPDVFLALPCGGHAGLWIEMKRQAGSHPTPTQVSMLATLRHAGYATTVCRGFDEAKAAIERYLAGRAVCMSRRGSPWPSKGHAGCSWSGAVIFAAARPWYRSGGLPDG